MLFSNEKPRTCHITPSYDQVAQLAPVAYAGGASLASVSWMESDERWDSLGRSRKGLA